MPTGRLITIEGLDGAGKSTLAAALRDRLLSRGLAVEALREPGGEPLAERIRLLLEDPAARGQIGARAETLLFAAARAQLVERVLRPALQAGRWVILDRFVDSTIAYQAAGRRLDRQQVRALNRFATGDLLPDRTILLQVEPLLGLERGRRRDQRPDRLEGEATAFFEAVGAGYQRIATEEPERIVSIDARSAADVVLEQALAAIADLLPPETAQAAEASAGTPGGVGDEPTGAAR